MGSVLFKVDMSCHKLMLCGPFFIHNLVVRGGLGI